MKNRLKAALDSRLHDMDWHGEVEVFRRIHDRRSIGRSARLRTAMIACALIVIFSATAFAVYMLHYSARQNRSMQAHAALNAKYGLTEDILSMFVETVMEDGESWTTRFELPIYGEQAGAYTARGENGAVHASWTHDGEAYREDGDLGSAVWGAPQLERMRLLYRTRAEMIAASDALGGYALLSLEDKAAIDEPLLALPKQIGYINILPDQHDLQPDAAEAIARAAVVAKYGVDAGMLEGCIVDIAFRLASSGEEYSIWFETDGSIRYHVVLTSPDGTVTLCDGNSLGDAQADSSKEEAEIADWDMTVEERAAYHEQMRQAGGDPMQWNSVLPEKDALTEQQAVAIANEALLDRFGLTGDTLQAMDMEVYCQLNYDLYEAPVKVWWIRYADSYDDYQVTLRVEDGTIEEVLDMDNTFGVG